MTPVQTTETQQAQFTAAPGPAPTQAQTQALERRQELAPIAVGDRGIQLQSYDDLWRFSSILFRSGFAPKDFKGPEACFVAIQMGMEVGLSPMASVQNIAVVNGRGTLWGDALMGVVRASRMLETFDSFWEIDGKRIERLPAVLPDGLTAVFSVKRLGEKPVTSTFSVVDAKRAGLWEKDGTWKQYPQRMLMNRARAFALRDAFGDILKGFRDKEEAGDVIDLPADAVTVESATNPGPLPVAAATRRQRSSPPIATLPAPVQAQIATSTPAAPPFVTVQGTAETVQTTPAPVAPAPVQPAAPAPAPVVQPVEVLKSEQQPTPNEQLRAVAEAAKYSFEEMVEAVNSNRWFNTSSWTSWESLPPSEAERLLKAKNGLARQVAQNREAKAKKAGETTTA